MKLICTYASVTEARNEMFLHLLMADENGPVVQRQRGPSQTVSQASYALHQLGVPSCDSLASFEEQYELLLPPAVPVQYAS